MFLHVSDIEHFTISMEMGRVRYLYIPELKKIEEKKNFGLK